MIKSDATRMVIAAIAMRTLGASTAIVGLLAPARAHAQVPWTVTLTPTVNPLAIGGCGPVAMTLTDSTGRNVPRNPLGQRVSIADFDMSVTSTGPRAVAGEYNGPSIWSACACQAATVGSSATITATYPAQSLSQKQVVPGVAFQATTSFTIAKPRGSYEPLSCQALKNPTAVSTNAAAPMGSASQASTAATTPTTPGITRNMPAGLSGPPLTKAVALGGAVGVTIEDVAPPPPMYMPSTMVLGGAAFNAYHVKGGSAVVVVSSTGGSIVRSGIVRYEPIVVGVAPGSPMDSWINSSWMGTAAPSSGMISDLNGPGQLSFTNAMILSTTVPALGARSQSVSGSLLVTLAPAAALEVAATVPAVPAGARSQMWDPSLSKLTIPNVNTSGVVGVSSFVVGQPGAVLAASTGQASTSAGPQGVTSLFVTVSEPLAADWMAWFNSSLAGGSAASLEKTFAIELFSKNAAHMATIAGTGVGIVALRSVITPNSVMIQSKQPGLLQAELYVRQIQLLP